MEWKSRLQDEWRVWTAKLREDAAGRLVHPSGLVATLQRALNGQPDVREWRCAVPQNDGVGEEFLYPVVLRFSAAFPREPPDVRFEPPVWHPNVDPQTGAVGVRAFLDAWRPETSVDEMLEQIRELFANPQHSPILNDQAAHFYNDYSGVYERSMENQKHRFNAELMLPTFDLSREGMSTPFWSLIALPWPEDSAAVCDAAEKEGQERTVQWNFEADQPTSSRASAPPAQPPPSAPSAEAAIERTIALEPPPAASFAEIVAEAIAEQLPTFPAQPLKEATSPTTESTADEPPDPPEVAPFARHADAIFRELQAAGRADLARKLRRKVLKVVNKFDEKLDRPKTPADRPKRADGDAAMVERLKAGARKERDARREHAAMWAAKRQLVDEEREHRRRFLRSPDLDEDVWAPLQPQKDDGNDEWKALLHLLPPQRSEAARKKAEEEDERNQRELQRLARLRLEEIKAEERAEEERRRLELSDGADGSEKPKKPPVVPPLEKLAADAKQPADAPRMDRERAEKARDARRVELQWKYPAMSDKQRELLLDAEENRERLFREFQLSDDDEERPPAPIGRKPRDGGVTSSPHAHFRDGPPRNEPKPPPKQPERHSFHGHAPPKPPPPPPVPAFPWLHGGRPRPPPPVQPPMPAFLRAAGFQESDRCPYVGTSMHPSPLCCNGGAFDPRRPRLPPPAQPPVAARFEGRGLYANHWNGSGHSWDSFAPIPRPEFNRPVQQKNRAGDEEDAFADAPKPPSAHKDEGKKLAEEMFGRVRVQQDFIEQQRREQEAWLKRAREVEDAPADGPKPPTAQPTAQPFERKKHEEEMLVQLIHQQNFIDQQRREQAEWLKRLQEVNGATKPPTAQAHLRPSMVAALMQANQNLRRNLQTLTDELQQRAREHGLNVPEMPPTAQPTAQEKEAPIQPVTSEQKQRSQPDAPAAQPEHETKGAEDLLMHVQTPTKQLQRRTEESGQVEKATSDSRAKIQQELQHLLPQQPAMELVACWVENPDGSTVPITPSTSSAPTAQEPHQSTSKQPEAPTIVSFSDSEDETDEDDGLVVIDSDFQ